MTTFVWKWAVLFSLFAGMTNAVGDVLFSHQPPRLEAAAAGYSNLGDISPPQQLADHFNLRSTAVITNASWWGIYYPSGLPANLTRVEFTFRFFADAGQRPGALVGEARVLASVIATSVFPGEITLYKFSGALNPPMLASGGVTYWVSILDSDPVTTEGFRWSEANLFEAIARATRNHETAPWYPTLNAWPHAWILEGRPPGSHPPVAVAKLLSTNLLSSNLNEYVVLALNDRTAHVTLDGSLSSDLDGDTLQYSWSESPTLRPIGTTSVVTARFRIGTHRIRLTVSDASASASDTINLKVETRAQAIGELISMIAQSDLRERDKRLFIRVLTAVTASINRGNDRAGINHLQALKNIVRAHIARTNPALAGRLIDYTDTLIRAMQGGDPRRTFRFH